MSKKRKKEKIRKKKKRKEKAALNLESNLSEKFRIIDGLFSWPVYNSLLIPG